MPYIKIVASGYFLGMGRGRGGIEGSWSVRTHLGTVVLMMHVAAAGLNA